MERLHANFAIISKSRNESDAKSSSVANIINVERKLSERAGENGNYKTCNSRFLPPFHLVL